MLTLLCMQQVIGITGAAFNGRKANHNQIVISDYFLDIIFL